MFPLKEADDWFLTLFNYIKTQKKADWDSLDYVMLTKLENWDDKEIIALADLKSYVLMLELKIQTMPR